MKVLNIIKKILQTNQTKFSYEELLRIYVNETGNFSPSSFEKFLSFSYGLKIFVKKGRKNERLYYLDSTKAKQIIAEWDL